MGSHYTYLTESSPKTVKGEKLNYLTGILYLSPSSSAPSADAPFTERDAADWARYVNDEISADEYLRIVRARYNVCPFATAGCIATCLNTAGRAGIMRKGETTNTILEARKRRTAAFFSDRKAFEVALTRDVAKLQRRAIKLGMLPAVRLNGTSDLRFDVFYRGLFTSFPMVTFYDYTKDLNKVRDYVAKRTPANYHVTFSWSENVTRQTLVEVFDSGVNVAVPYVGDPARIASKLPAAPASAHYVDGDAHDLRFLDGDRGAIVALTAKGKAKRDTTGFVVRT